MLGEHCTSGCPTRDHDSWGSCQRSKNVAVLDPAGVVHRSAWDREMSAYEAAKRQGVQPSSTRQADIDNAMRISEATGQAYQA